MGSCCGRPKCLESGMGRRLNDEAKLIVLGLIIKRRNLFISIGKGVVGGWVCNVVGG